MDVLTVLAEPRRRRLLHLCAGAERSVTELHETMPEVTMGAVSQHLARLREAGLVTVRPDGRQRFYRSEPERLRQLAAGIDAMWGAGLDRLSAMAADATTSDATTPRARR
ncbi:MAG: ArsR/SmtB family transcription factor [Acidimicrobiia bacterium]